MAGHVMQVGYLQDMSTDVHSLGRCATVLERYRHGPRPSHYESAVREGNSLATKCCNWCVTHFPHLHSSGKTEMVALPSCHMPSKLNSQCPLQC